MFFSLNNSVTMATKNCENLCTRKHYSVVQESCQDNCTVDENVRGSPKSLSIEDALPELIPYA